MHNLILMQVLETREHLEREISASVFAHRSQFLANIKQYIAIHILQHQIDDVIYGASRWLNNLAFVAEVDQSDDALVV